MSAPQATRAILRGVLGPATGFEAVVHAGETLTVGRNGPALHAIPADALLSGTHFQLDLTGPRLLLRDLDSRNGTFIGGGRIQVHEPVSGDLIAAGASIFKIEIELPASDTVVAVHPADLLAGLSATAPAARSGALFAVLDAARDPSIYPILVGSGVPYASLYAGESAASLEHVAPYLAALPPGSPFLDRLVTLAWGHAWGIFLTAALSFDEVRGHLRRSLMVRLGDSPRLSYFRFYDPRVLRVFLPLATSDQVQQFTGGIAAFIAEDGDPGILLRFDRSGQPTRIPIRLDAPRRPLTAAAHPPDRAPDPGPPQESRTPAAPPAATTVYR